MASFIRTQLGSQCGSAPNALAPIALSRTLAARPRPSSPRLVNGAGRHGLYVKQEQRQRYYSADRCSDSVNEVHSERAVTQKIQRLLRKRRVLQQRRLAIQTRLVASLIVQYELSLAQIAHLIEQGQLGQVQPRALFGAFFAPEYSSGTPALPKYYNPKTGEQWSGRGQTPRWLRLERERGVDPESFRTKASLQRERLKQPLREPKYCDPATGKTWSGFGRTPNWMRRALKAGKRKEDFLIERLSEPNGQNKG